MPRREGSGRKKLDDPKSNKVSMRLSSEELLQFEAYAEKHNLSKANVLRNQSRNCLRETKRNKLFLTLKKEVRRWQVQNVRIARAMP